MEPSNFLDGLYRHKTILGIILFISVVAGATVIPDNTTIVGDLTIQTTNGIDINPGSDVDADLLSIGVTGSPKVKWDESEDAFQFIEKLLLGTNASLSKTINATSYSSKMSLDTDTTTNSGGIDITRHGTSDPGSGVLSIYRSRGTHSSPSIVQDGDVISSIVGYGFDGTDYEPAASIIMSSDGTPGSNDMPGRIDFKTVADGSRVLNQVMRIGSNSDVMIGTSTSDASSILEVQSVTRGSRPAPRMQQTERNNIISPATGLMVFNTDFATYDIYNGSSWVSFLDNSTAQEFSGKTVTDSLKFKETGGGSNYTAFQAPASLTGDVTFTLPDGDGTAGQALKTDGAGTLEWGDAAASGGGGLNYISNYDAETDTTGYATYADAAGTSPVDGTGGSANSTWTRSTSSPLRDDASFVFTHNSGASRQGEGVSYDFSISAADKAKVLQISFDYIVGSGTFVAGSSSTDSDMTVWIYDVTNSTLIQPSSYKLLSNSSTIASQFNATFQTASDSTSYRLIFHVGSTSASAYTLKFDNIKVSPSTYVYGTPVTDWQSETPVFTGLGTVTSIEIYSRRVGDSLQMRGNYTTGTTTATEARISLAYRGATVTAAAIPSIRVAGNLFFSTASASVGTILSEPSVGYITLGTQNATYSGLIKQNGSLYGSSQKFTFFCEVPIQGWSSSVQTSDQTDTRVVAAKVSFSADQTGVNPNNSAVKLNFNSITTNGAFDTHGAYDTSAFRYNVKVPGKYQVGGVVTLANTNVLNNRYILLVYKNGSEVLRGEEKTPAAGTYTSLTFSGLVNTVAGDYLEVYVYGVGNNSASTLTVIGASSHFNVSRLSGPSAIAASETVAARYSSTAGQSITNATTPVVDFATKTFDSHGAVTTGASWKFTAPISGKYNVRASILWASAAFTSNSASTIYIYKNTAVYSARQFRQWAGLTTSYHMQIDDDVQLSAGDYIDIRCDHGESSARSINTATGYTNVSIKRIGN